MDVSSLTSGAAPVALSAHPGAAQSAAPATNSGAAAAGRAPAGTNAAPEATRAAGPNPALDRQELQRALEDVQAVIRPIANDLTFSIDEDTGRTLIKIVDSQTDEVIRQIPSEEMLRIAKALDKLQGLLIKQEA